MASFTWGHCKGDFSLLHISLIHGGRPCVADAAGVEAARSAGGRGRGGPDSSRTRRLERRVAIENGDGLGDFRLYCEGVCFVLYYYYYYTPFMSRRIVTEVLGTYSDGQSRGNGQVGVIDGLRTPVYSFIASDGGYVYDQPPRPPPPLGTPPKPSMVPTSRARRRLWSVASGLRARASSPRVLVKHVAHRASPPSAHLLVIDMTGRNR